MVRLASYVSSGVFNNDVFNRQSPNNRDHGFEATILLKDLFAQHGIELNTPDVNAGKLVEFEIHLDARETPFSGPKYLIKLETPAIHKANSNPRLLTSYRKIFTWNDTQVDGQRHIKLNFPNLLEHSPFVPFAQRNRFCCVIAGNKSVANHDDRELYSERVNSIRWFEQHAPSEFDLYGTDWNFPPPPPGLLGKLHTRFWRVFAPWLKFKFFPSYRGRVACKSQVLSNTRFSLCYENVRDVPGYITEKIFDCFLSGCVPVYWGANNISDHIPADCFVDRRRFNTTAEVYAHLRQMDDATYTGYQERISSFLGSSRAKPFGIHAFASTIVQHITMEHPLEG